MTFDLNKITGREPPLVTDSDKDAQIQELREVLQDIVLGADIMLQGPVGGAIQRYAAEVKRVAQSGLTS